LKPIKISTDTKLVTNAVNLFYDGKKPGGRWASWDYCFSYFQEVRSTNPSGSMAIANAANISASCQRLHNFLGSWGMLVRGNALSQTSFIVLKPVIGILANPASAPVWDLDVDGYFLLNPGTGKWTLSPAAVQLLQLIKPKGLIEKALNAEFKKVGIKKMATDTLVTKIVLATTGSVVGYDKMVKRNTDNLQRSESGLRKIFDFHQLIAPTVAKLRSPALGCPLDPPLTNQYCYTRAKVLDMLFTEA
jgi:hypothetical protein